MLNNLTVTELKAMCKTRGIRGYSKLKNDGLIARLSQGKAKITFKTPMRKRTSKKVTGPPATKSKLWAKIRKML